MMVVKNHNLLENIGQVKYFLFEAYFPSFCVNCQSERNLHFIFLCSDCFEKIEYVKTPTCLRCGRITKIGQFCSECQGENELSGVIYAMKYTDPVKELVHWFKYGKMLGIGNFLAKILIDALEERLPRGDAIIVPVPLFYKKKMSRGFNQSEIIGRKIGNKFSIPLAMGLKRTRDTKSQMKLKRRERLTNLENAFRVTKPELVGGKTVLLIDDVLTTGSTLEECARVLRAAGARHVWGVVLAKG